MIGGDETMDPAVYARIANWQTDVWRRVAWHQEKRAKAWRATALVITAVSVVSHAMIWWVCK